MQFDPPGPAHGLSQKHIRRTLLVTDTDETCDALLAGMHSGSVDLRQIQGQLQHTFVSTAEQGQRTMRGNFGDLLAVLKVIGEFAAVVFLTFDDSRGKDRIIPEVLAQL